MTEEEQEQEVVDVLEEQPPAQTEVAGENVPPEDVGTAAVSAPGGDPETCSTCRHCFQLACQRIGNLGKLRTVKPDDHCSLWE